MTRRKQVKRSDPQSRYRHLSHPFTPQRIMSDDQVAMIHDNALHVLETYGMRILLSEARDILERAGATVRDDMVHIGRDLVNAALASAPKTFTLGVPNPDRAQEMYLGRMLFGGSGGCPNANDRIRGRRAGDKTAFCEALKLQQHFEVIHKFSPSAEPQDVPITQRHYTMTASQISIGDKPMFAYARGPRQTAQIFEMVQIALNLTASEFATTPYLSSVINTNSPRLLDNPMAQGLIDFARAGQLIIVTPFCLAGAMAPITVAGALTLQHAEALAAITLNQMTKTGAPIMYGGFGSNVDMKSGAPAFGTPTQMQMTIGSGQLARHIGLPWRSAGGAASNTADMQAAGENHNAMWATLMAQSTVTFHAAGWLEGGLSFGYEKFINDIEMLQSLAHYSLGTDMSEGATTTDVFAEVAPGGHFFETAQTMERYGQEFYKPLVADLQNYGAWELAGAQTSTDRATQIWQNILADFRAPEGCAERAARLDQYIADHIAKGGAPIMD